MVIKTEVTITKEEIYKLVEDHMINIHGLEVDYFKLKEDDWGKFGGFDLTIKKIETSIDKKHENTPNFEKKKERTEI